MNRRGFRKVGAAIGAFGTLGLPDFDPMIPELDRITPFPEKYIEVSTPTIEVSTPTNDDFIPEIWAKEARRIFEKNMFTGGVVAEDYFETEEDIINRTYGGYRWPPFTG